MRGSTSTGPACRSRCTAAVSRCTRTCSAWSDDARADLPPLTLRDLAPIDVDRLKGVGDKKLASLHEVGVDTVLDLLTTYPRRWVDRTNEARVSDLVPGQEALVLVTVRSVTKRTMPQPAHDGRGRRSATAAGGMHVVFFNQPWRERQLREGLQVALFGKADVYRGGLQMTNPIVDLIGDRTGRIVPIYPQSEKAQLTTWEIAGWVEDALRALRRRAASPTRCRRRSRRRLGLVDRGTTRCRASTCPRRWPRRRSARRRLAFDELLRVQTVLVMRKRALERESQGIRHDVDGELVGRLRAALPYELTGAQQRAIGEIEADLAGPHPMHRLLQGDVGAGKTLVAVSAMLTAVQGGHQGALMAPTEVLAEQHATGVRRLLDGVTRARPRQPVRRSAAARRAAHQPRHRRASARDVLAGLADGTVDIAIGTHALIQEAVDVPQPRRGRGRRAAPLRRRAARRAARQGRRRRWCPTCW